MLGRALWPVSSRSTATMAERWASGVYRSITLTR